MTASPLTPREKEILVLLTQDKCVKEISDAFGTSNRTVEKQCERMRKKWKVSSMFPILYYAVKNGWL